MKEKSAAAATVMALLLFAGCVTAFAVEPPARPQESGNGVQAQSLAATGESQETPASGQEAAYSGEAAASYSYAAGQQRWSSYQI